MTDRLDEIRARAANNYLGESLLRRESDIGILLAEFDRKLAEFNRLHQQVIDRDAAAKSAILDGNGNLWNFRQGGGFL